MPILQAEGLMRFAQEVFEACGSPSQEAALVADHLIGSSLLGVDSHGVMRIPQYVREVREGAIRPAAPVIVTQEENAAAVVDCGWNFGQVGAVRAMQVAIKKARVFHTACVVTQRCGHAGRLGAYTELAARESFLAIGACNSPRHGHFVLPWGGGEGRLATNPISFAIPTGSGDPIVADFSTAAAPEGKLRLFRDQGRRLPEGWIVDGQGKPTTDPADFYGPPRGAILPFGREAGYRGFALALLVEVLGGTLAGLDITVDQPGNGVAYIVIDVSAFLPREKFYQLVGRLRDYIKSSKPAEGFEEVLLPGEPEFRTAKARQQNGIALDDATWQTILSCGESLGVKWRAEAPMHPDVL